MSDQDELQAETNLIADVEAIKQKIIELLKD
jgi:hypothetical protein